MVPSRAKLDRKDEEAEKKGREQFLHHKECQCILRSERGDL